MKRPLKRYSISAVDQKMIPDFSGDYVKYEDVITIFKDVMTECKSRHNKYFGAEIRELFTNMSKKVIIESLVEHGGQEILDEIESEGKE